VQGTVVKVVCVGGGPAGLCTAVLMKRRAPGLDVAVVERNPAGATHGWGVVFWDDLLDDLNADDPAVSRAVRSAACLWEGQQVRLPGNRSAHLGGYGYSIGRARLLQILTERADDLGVDLRFESEADPAELAAADLVVAADGAGSGLREALATRSARASGPGSTGTSGSAHRRSSTRSPSPSRRPRPAGSGSTATRPATG